MSHRQAAPKAAPPSDEKPPPASPLALGGLAAGILFLLYHAFEVFARVHDDAFITYRYAYHLRHGYGPVFNPGDRVEGYSCPLYMALTALGMFLPGDVLVRAKLLGVAFALGALWAAWKLADEIGLPDWMRGAVALALGVNGSFAMSAVDGMETSLQALLVTLAARAFVRERRPPPDPLSVRRGAEEVLPLTKGGGQRGWSSALWLVAAALNRPEGVLFFLAALVPFALDVRRRQPLPDPSPGMEGRGSRKGWRRDAVWLAVFAIPTALFFLWRKSYYGDWLPNTYYAKAMPLETALELELGPAYLLRTVFVNLDQRAALMAISALLWLFAIGGAASDRLRRGGALAIPLFVAAQTAVALRAGGDWMQGWRFMMAVTPLWTLLIIAGLGEMVEAVLRRGGRTASHALAAAGVAAFVGVCLWAAPEFRRPNAGGYSWAEQGWATDARGLLRNYDMENTVLIADFLNRTLPAGVWVAYSEMGATPYFTPQLRYIDVYGLLDRTIARMAALSKFRFGRRDNYMDPSTEVGKYLLERRPDYVLNWIYAATTLGPILDGTYVPMARLNLKSFLRKRPIVFQVWKRVDP